MAEFPPDLYPPAPDFTREDILRQIFGEVGELHYGKHYGNATALIVISPHSFGRLVINLPHCIHEQTSHAPSKLLSCSTAACT
jgi:hypothetical protein